MSLITFHHSAEHPCGASALRGLAENYRMDWEFDVAENGKVALVGELDLRHGHEFTLGVSFGNSLHSATTDLLQPLSFPFSEHGARFVAQWGRACNRLVPSATGDGGHLYRASHLLLLAHEDKIYPGAMIASLSIPWGEARGTMIAAVAESAATTR